MSREFGEHGGCYFHHLIDNAADDAAAGDDEITRLWGVVLRAFHPVAHAIASSEAGDAGPDLSILRTTQQMPEIRRALRAIDDYTKPFEYYASEAVKQALKRRSMREKGAREVEDSAASCITYEQRRSEDT